MRAPENSAKQTRVPKSYDHRARPKKLGRVAEGQCSFGFALHLLRSFGLWLLVASPLLVRARGNNRKI
jgi:hypothetical protein